MNAGTSCQPIRGARATCHSQSVRINSFGGSPEDREITQPKQYDQLNQNLDQL